MRRLILSDIHANFPAFEAVLDHAGNYDEIIFLGDLVNFGPHPCECIDLMRELNAFCIMGNHDYLIAHRGEKRNFWDEWARTQLSDHQLLYLKSFRNNMVIDNEVFALHGSYSVPYDILPNTPHEQIEEAFNDCIPQKINNVIFGHYHYQIDVVYKNVEYHCIRPVGHHRDKDNRASYSILENGQLTHFRVPYDIERTINDVDKIDCFDSDGKQRWKHFLKNAFDEKFLRNDIRQMMLNDGYNNVEGLK